jgi:hypothetical protein
MVIVRLDAAQQEAETRELDEWIGDGYRRWHGY